MKKLVFGVLLCAASTITAQTSLPATGNRSPETGNLQWYSFEQAVELQKTAPKKMFIDVYTDWCGWCKRMDKSTFTDPDVTAYLAANFYPVKLNAEQKAEIAFNGHTFKFMESGSRGVHELAYSLLDGQLGYPAFVYLNEKFERIMISPGYKEPKDLLPELRFAAEEHYEKTSWEEFRKN
jgi:thioredoxin-related protein